MKCVLNRHRREPARCCIRRRGRAGRIHLLAHRGLAGSDVERRGFVAPGGGSVGHQSRRRAHDDRSASVARAPAGRGRGVPSVAWRRRAPSSPACPRPARVGLEEVSRRLHLGGWEAREALLWRVYSYSSDAGKRQHSAPDAGRHGPASGCPRDQLPAAAWRRKEAPPTREA